jgi:hypothetical protein
VLGGGAAIGLLLLVFWGLPWLLNLEPNTGLTAEQELKAKSDVRTTLVHAVGGLAIAAGAIVTYRTFRHNQLDQVKRWEEQDRSYALNLAAQVTETYAEAVEQLGHKKAPVPPAAAPDALRRQRDAGICPSATVLGRRRTAAGRGNGGG